MSRVEEKVLKNDSFFFSYTFSFHKPGYEITFWLLSDFMLSLSRFQLPVLTLVTNFFFIIWKLLWWNINPQPFVRNKFPHKLKYSNLRSICVYELWKRLFLMLKFSCLKTGRRPYWGNKSKILKFRIYKITRIQDLQGIIKV